jgi:rare lipoprotein A (peptidoglycan hydrolase)
MISNWRLHIILGALSLTILSLAVSCATRTQPELPQPSLPLPALETTAPSFSVPVVLRASSKPSRTVRASYQGDEYAGHRTASGEPYDPDALTAASRTLPIGSTVMVTNPATGHSVKVRINDRGPGVHGRGLDLSKRAAEEIGMTKKGVARVRVGRVDSKPAKSESPSSLGGSSSMPTPKS